MSRLSTDWGELSSHHISESVESRNKCQIQIAHNGSLFDNYYEVHDVVDATRGVTVLDFTWTHLVLEVDHHNRDLEKLSMTMMEAIAAKAARKSIPASSRKERAQKPVKKALSRR